MKRIKALVLLLLAAFLAFAPPGTLILLAVLLASWLGWEAAVVVVLVACSVGAWWIVLRIRSARSRSGTTGDH